MRKKGFVPDASVSILLTVPEGVTHKEAAAAFLSSADQKSQPFFFNPEEGTVTIGLVRELLHHTSFARAEREPQALVVCATQTATLPAQNALLKIVEEPPANTQIILVVLPGHQLLPTLVSRCREILWTETPEKSPEETVKDLTDLQQQLDHFLQAPDRFSLNQAVLLAEQLKDGAVAKQLLKTALAVHTQPNQALPPTTMQQLLLALNSLEKNGNVRLTLEHFLFASRTVARA